MQIYTASSIVFSYYISYVYTHVYTHTGQLSTYHIAQLFYMDGSQNHEKDAFGFLIHDLNHMENFIQEDIHYEQVCNSCILSIVYCHRLLVCIDASRCLIYVYHMPRSLLPLPIYPTYIYTYTAYTGRFLQVDVCPRKRPSAAVFRPVRL